MRVPPDAVGVDLDRRGGFARLGLQRRAQAMVGEHRRVDAAGQVPQVVERGAHAVLHRWGELPHGGGVVRGFLQQSEMNGERDELLLRPVVQVPFDLPPFGFLGFHQPSAGGSQVLDRRPQFGGQRGVAQIAAAIAAIG